MITQEEFERRFNKKIEALEASKIVMPAATAAHNSMLQRLFDKGIGGDNQKLGNYSTKPAYFSKKQFKKTGAFVARGNPEKKRKKKGNKTMYIKNGYKGLKAVQGYVSDRVNLTYSADLRQDFATHLVPTKKGAAVKLSRKINAGKVKWLSDKYGAETFKHTKEEIELFKQETTKALLKIMKP